MCTQLTLYSITLFTFNLELRKQSIVTKMTNTAAMNPDNTSDRDDIIEIQHRFTEMCSNLNIESSITEQAWDEFKRIHSNVTLEVYIPLTLFLFDFLEIMFCSTRSYSNSNI